MDSLTHVLFGAVLAQTGFRRRLGRRAIVAAVAITSLPDLDVAAAWVEGRFAEWQHHRGFTHSLAFAPVAGPVIGWAIDRFADAAPIDVDGTTAAVRQQLGDGSGRITATDSVNLAWITVPESASDAEAAAFLSMVMRAAG